MRKIDEDYLIGIYENDLLDNKFLVYVIDFKKGSINKFESNDFLSITILLAEFYYPNSDKIFDQSHLKIKLIGNSTTSNAP